MNWISPTVMFIIIGDSVASLLTISSTFNSLFKVLCIFPSRYLCAIGLSLVFSFRWNLPPSLGLHSQTTRLEENNNITKSVIFPFLSFVNREILSIRSCTGLSPSMIPLSRGVIPSVWFESPLFSYSNISLKVASQRNIRAKKN